MRVFEPNKKELGCSEISEIMDELIGFKVLSMRWIVDYVAK